MAHVAIDDELGRVVAYSQNFSGQSCPLSVTNLNRLRDSLQLTRSTSSVSDGEDHVIQGNPGVSFRIRGGDCEVKIGHHTRTIKRISDLPGNDAVLHYADQKDLGSMEKKIIKAFTKFLRDHGVLLTGRFACLQNVRPEVNDGNKECVIEADRPVPLHVSSMNRSWCADEIGVLAVERDEGRRLYHFSSGGYDDKRRIRDKFIYGGGDMSVQEAERRLEVVDSGRLARESFVINCFAVEWLKQLEAVASDAYVTPQVIRLERIVEIWDHGVGETDGGNNGGQRWMEIRRLFAELGRIHYEDSEYFHKAKAGLKYNIMLKGELSTYHEPGERRDYWVEGGNVDRVESVTKSLEKGHIFGPAFDVEAWITFGLSMSTARRATHATKRGRTLHEVCRLMGLDNVYEMRPYLWTMGYRAYVAGACFLHRTEMVRGRDVEDARAWHFKVKDLLGYIYSNKLSRRSFGVRPVEAVLEGETVYYRPIPPPSDDERLEDPRLPPEWLDKYVGGAGYDPRSTGAL